VELPPRDGRGVTAAGSVAIQALGAKAGRYLAAGGGVVAAITATTLASQFFRSATSALGPELIHDLALTPQGLGLANAAFFISLMLSQIPVGMLFDRFGPRRVVSALTVLTVLGAALHAAATSETGFILARLLVGLGCAGSFMSAVVLCGRWYRGERYSTMLSRVFALSSLGNLLAGTPWAALASAVGWRAAFAVSALLAAATGVVFYALVRDAPASEKAPHRESLREIVAGLGKVWTVPGLLPILAMHFVAYAAGLTVFGVWAGPYLNDVFGLEPVARGNVLLVMAGAQMAGTLTYGPLDRIIGTRRGLVAGGCALSLVVLGGLAALPHPPGAAAIAALIVFSLVSTYSVVNVADANSRFPPAVAGRGATAVNLIQVIGTSLVPVATGAIIGFFPESATGRPEAAYRAAFAFIAASLALGLLLYWFWYTKPRKR
jgi:MFS family permease